MDLGKLRRHLAGGAAVLLVMAELAACQHQAAPAGQAREVERLTFRQRDPGSAGVDKKVSIAMEEGTGGRIRKFYSLVTFADGSPVSESLWEIGSAGREQRRDWTNCTASDGDPPDDIPATVQQALDSIVGPSSVPEEAERLGDGRWRLTLGRSVMTVRQVGEKQTDRVITLGVPSNPDQGTAIDEIRMDRVIDRMELLTTWKACNPAKR
ncbi:hypothetical protein ACFP3U_18625 [Kitasatospora misakiensis]|uniref:Lipoprotein n=1 Tax=Kitasatospora misakiensis TaxID=67330 RepID=A0ABW0X357_9ACTN